MEKLLDLLNEYENKDLELEEWEESNARTENNWHLRFNGANKVQFDTYMFDSLALSKQYWFIKWLVENEKIDYEKVRSWEWNGSRWHFETVQPEYYIIMLLAIQDEPIEFLISILKNV
jgi:hypothetical protein